MTMGDLPFRQIDVNKAPLVAVIGFPMNSIIALLLFYNSGVHVGNMANSNSILSDPNIDDLLPKNAGKKLYLPEYFPERNFFYTNQWQLGMFHLVYASAYLSILLALLTRNCRPLLLFLVYAMLGFCIQQSVCAYRFYYEVWPPKDSLFAIKFEEFASFFFYCVSFIVNTMFLAIIFCMHATMKKMEAEEEFQHQKQRKMAAAAAASTVGYGGGGGMPIMPQAEVMTPNLLMNNQTPGAVEMQMELSISNNCSNGTSMLPRY